MFEPIDAVYVWLGLGAVAVALVGLTASVPTQPAPDANQLAGVIDRTSVATPPARTTYRTAAEAVRITGESVALRNARGTVHARLAFGPVVAVGDGRLARVARGAPPQAVFPDRAAFAARVANATTPGWQTGSQVTIAHVTWGRDVTLVAVAG